MRFGARAWPHIRATLLLLHIATLIVLSLPGSYVVDKRRWSTPDNQADLAGWSQRLRSVGFHLTEPELEERLFSIATSYASVMAHVSSPFREYAHWAGTHQAWVMFSSPERHPREIHVDLVDAAGRATPLYRPRSDEFNWRRGQFDHDRFRKLQSRFGKGVAGGAFDDVARYLARRAFDDFPDARRVRVSMYAYDLLGPDRVRAGEIPQGHYETRVELGREDVR